MHTAIDAARLKGATTAEVRFAPAEAGDYVVVILPNISLDQAELVRAGLGVEEARALHEIHGKRKTGGSTLTVFRNGRLSSVDYVGDQFDVRGVVLVQKKSYEAITLVISLSSEHASFGETRRSLGGGGKVGTTY